MAVRFAVRLQLRRFDVTTSPPTWHTDMITSEPFATRKRAVAHMRTLKARYNATGSIETGIRAMLGSDDAGQTDLEASIEDWRR